MRLRGAKRSGFLFKGLCTYFVVPLYLLCDMFDSRSDMFDSQSDMSDSQTDMSDSQSDMFDSQRCP